jgi:protein-L-isoaspartate(D-aspartate) O-methyltransferase
MNFNTARENMLLNQVRTWDYISPDIIEIMRKLQREEFVPVEHRKLAFSDLEIPLAHDEMMMRPIVEGRILQALELTGDEKVLEIGTGSAYMTALLALSSKHVTSIDIHQSFTDSAIEKLTEANISNVDCLNQDLYSSDFTDQYDRIVITGSLEEAPEFLFKNINKGGKIFAIIGDDPIMEACIISKNDTEGKQVESLFETVVKPLTTPEETSIFEL